MMVIFVIVTRRASRGFSESFSNQHIIGTEKEYVNPKLQEITDKVDFFF